MDPCPPVASRVVRVSHSMSITPETVNEYRVQLFPGQSIFAFAKELQEIVQPIALKHLLNDVLTEAVMERDADCLDARGLIHRPRMRSELREATPWYRATLSALQNSKIYNTIFTCLQDPADADNDVFYLIIDCYHESMNFEIAGHLTRHPNLTLFPLARRYEPQLNFPFAPETYSYDMGAKEYEARQAKWEALGVSEYLTQSKSPGLRFVAHGLDWVKNTLSATRFMGEHDTSNILERLNYSKVQRAETLVPALYLHRNRPDDPPPNSSPAEIMQFLMQIRLQMEETFAQDTNLVARLRDEILSIIPDNVTWEDLTAADPDQILREMS